LYSIMHYFYCVLKRYAATTLVMFFDAADGVASLLCKLVASARKFVIKKRRGDHAKSIAHWHYRQRGRTQRS